MIDETRVFGSSTWVEMLCWRIESECLRSSERSASKNGTSATLIEMGVAMAGGQWCGECTEMREQSSVYWWECQVWSQVEREWRRKVMINGNDTRWSMDCGRRAVVCCRALRWVRATW